MTAAVVPVPLPASPYDILIGTGQLDRLGETLAERCPAHEYVIVADSVVAGLYGDRAVRAVAAYRPCTLLAFPAGEWNKTVGQWRDLSERLLARGLGRDGAIVSLGGGVAGDLAGFVAATYLRGIPVVHVPTTLLAMIDASIGGKTGVDTTHGKNLIGAFHQPRAVVVDPGTLETLPAVHLVAGIAEALKHGAIADAGYFEWLVGSGDRVVAKDPDVLVEVVRRSVEIKAGIIAEDERESGRRAVLNFGHTVAHAIEAVAGFAVPHGEAVAVGLAVEADLGRRIGVTDDDAVSAIRHALEAFGLPRAAEHLGPRLIDAMATDKKRRGGTVRFALIERIGKAARGKTENWTFEVVENDLLAALEGR